MSRPVCISCQQPKPIASKGLCFSCFSKVTRPAAPAAVVAMPKNELLDMLEASLELLTNNPPSIGVIKESAAPVKSNGVKPANGDSAAKKGQTYTCDGCDKEFKTLQKFGKLNLCVECFTTEQNASVALHEYDPKNYKTWPRCNKCHAHVVREQLDAQDGVCFKCAQSKPAKVDNLSVKPTDSSLYQDFFNAETQSIIDLMKEQGEQQGILALRQIIIAGKELLSKEEAAVFKTKTQLQARQIKYNDMLSKLSEDEQKKLRIEDASYKVKATGGDPKKNKSPMAQLEKTKKLKKSLDDQINSMFGGTLSQAEIAEKKKALGL